MVNGTYSAIVQVCHCLLAKVDKKIISYSEVFYVMYLLYVCSREMKITDEPGYSGEFYRVILGV